MKKINKLEDISPLTIISMRHGKFAIIEGYSLYDCISSLQENEDWQYDPHHYMKLLWEDINYGIGNDINEAFIDFKDRYK